MKKIILLISLLGIIIIIGSVSVAINSWRSAPYSTEPIHKEILLPKIITATTSPALPTTETLLPSRLWMLVAEDVVKKNNLPPPSAARVYAYTATAYADTLEASHDPEFANAATKSILLHLYPLISLDTSIQELFGNKFSSTAYSYLYTDTSTSSLSVPTSTLLFLDSDHQLALQKLTSLFQHTLTDGFSAPFTDTVPATKWRVANLVTPNAGKWQRWILDPKVDFSTPLPPASGSKTYKDEIEKLKNSTAQRTLEQENMIRTWLTSSSTQSGVWQDILWQYFSHTASTDMETDLKYAHEQKLLAQGLADTYSSVWQIKYTYWRARPVMVIPKFTSFIPTPNSPTYVSEDAAVAHTAALLINTWFPEHQTELIHTSEIIRDSSVWSGVAFELDSREGFNLGEKVAVELLKSVN
jgi:hypothetical protein